MSPSGAWGQGVPSRLSLNLVSVGPAPLERKLHAASAAGFRAVGLAWEELSQEGEAGAEEVKLSGLEVSDLVALVGWMEEDRTARTVGLARAEQAFELAARLGCGLVTAWPSSQAVELATAAARFRELCRLAAPHQVRVGLEFLGGVAQVSNLRAAWEVVESAGAGNAGLVIDSFHFFRGASDLQMLEPVPGEKLFLVQISDCMDLPRHEMQDRHRIYPGEGVLPLEPLLAALLDKGYSGYYSLELHNEAYWQEDAVVVAREGLRAMRRLDLR